MADCDCLRTQDGTLRHYETCAVWDGHPGDDADSRDIRVLAELAAYRDIDTALSILRRHKEI